MFQVGNFQVGRHCSQREINVKLRDFIKRAESLYDSDIRDIIRGRHREAWKKGRNEAKHRRPQITEMPMTVNVDDNRLSCDLPY